MVLSEEKATIVLGMILIIMENLKYKVVLEEDGHMEVDKRRFRGL